MRKVTYILAFLLVFLSGVASSQVNTFQAQPGYVVSIQNQLNALQAQIAQFLLPPNATAGQFIIENAAGTGYVAATITGDIACSTSVPGDCTVTGSSATNFKVINLIGNWIGEIDPCQHGLNCNAQVDKAVTANNGSPTIVISGTQGGVFTPASVGQVIKITDGLGTDTYVGTIATYISASSVTIGSNYGGANTTSGAAVWGSPDAAGFNTTLQTFIGPTTASVWYPRIVHCHAPILADAGLVWSVKSAEFKGTGHYAQMISSTNEDQNGCVIEDMNPNNGTAGVDVLQIQGNIGGRFHDFSIDGSTLYPKRGLITLSQSGGRTSSQNWLWNVGNLATGGLVHPPTWGLNGTCVPAGNISGSTITCGSAPTGLNNNQPIYIYDYTVGFEKLYVSSIAGTSITTTANLATTHTSGQFTIFYDPNPIAVAGLYIDSANSQTDTNLFQNLQFDYVDTALDIRQQQSVGNSLDVMICQNVASCININNGGALVATQVQQNNTSIGWYLSSGAILDIRGWSTQPSAPGTGSIAAGTNLFGVFGNTGGAPGGSFIGENIGWAQNSSQPVAGEWVMSGPNTFRAKLKINDLTIAQSTGAPPLPAQYSPVIHYFFGFEGAGYQSFFTDVDYQLSVGSGALSLQYLESGTPQAATNRRVRLCPGTANQEYALPQCTDNLLMGTDTFQRFRTDIPGQLQTWDINLPQLTPAHPTGMICLDGAGADVWDYYATVCGDPGCVHESTPSSVGAASCAYATIDATHRVGGMSIPPKGAAAVRFYRCPTDTPCAAPSAVLEYTVPVNQSTALSASTPSKTGFVDTGNGVGSGAPPTTNGTGSAAIAGNAAVTGLTTASSGVVNGCQWSVALVAGVASTAVPCLANFSNVAITGVSGGAAATTLATPAATPAVIACAQPTAQATSVTCVASTANATPVVHGIGY